MASNVTRAESMSKPKLVLCLVAIYLTGMTITQDLAIQPITDLLYGVFGGDPSWVVSFGVTGMAFVAAPIGFVAGGMCDRMDKKFVLLLGFGIFAVCGICAGLVPSAYYFMIMRIMASGVGWGFVNTAVLGILADLFLDEAAHARYVGFFTAIQSVLGMIMAAIAGVLALSGWNHVFYVYLIAVPIFFLVLFCVPSFPPAAKTSEADDNAAGASQVEQGWWKPLIPLTVQVFFASLIFFTLQFFIAMFIADAGAGDSSTAGFAASVMTFGCMLGGFAFGPIYSRMHTAFVPLAIALFSASMIVMAFVPSVAVIYVTCFVAGFFWMAYMSYFFTRCVELAPSAKAATATAIVAVGDNIGGGLCAFVVTALLGATGMSTVGLWPCFGVAGIILAVVSAFFYVATKNKAPYAKKAVAASE